MKFLDEHIEQLNSALLKYGKQSRILIAVEEMTELSKELLKNINRGKQNETEIAEEMTDVYIMLEQLKDIYNISEEKLSQIACEKFLRWKKKELGL